MTLPLLALIACVAVIGCAASCVLTAKPRKIERGELRIDAEYWRMIERHERRRDSWL